MRKCKNKAIKSMKIKDFWLLEVEGTQAEAGATRKEPMLRTMENDE